MIVSRLNKMIDKASPSVDNYCHLGGENMLIAVARKKWGVMLMISVTILLLALVAGSCSGSDKTGESYDIALYSDNGIWQESVTALEHMFNWMGYSVRVIDAEYINSKSLSGFRALAIPGGDMFEYGRSISEPGKTNIREFIDQGHGYIGVCGGAYFAAKQTYWRGVQLSYSPLGIFDGTSTGPNNDIVAYPGYGMCRLVMSDTLFPPDSGTTRDEWMLYYWGPEFQPNNGANAAVLGKYAATNKAAIVAFNYGRGRVFLIGTHPEIEEDSDRDSVSFGNELDDRGSEWEFMKRATGWCLQ
jgi:glutamine amidotransferase-like uncharacterized protein